MSAADSDPSVAGTLRAVLHELRQHLRRKLGSHADADDVAQEAFLRMWEAKGAREIRDPKSFLYRTARNVTIDRARHEQVRNLIDLPLETTADETPSQERSFAAREELLLVYRSIRDLPPMRRAAYELYLDDHGFDEIAARLGISNRTARAHVARAILDVAAAHGRPRPVRRRS